jgi:hypothetical protein
MPPSLTDTFRQLASFDPPRTSLRGAPWDAYVGWAVAQGLAPLAAYNLEYRLGGGGAPDWVRDRLLSLYQGVVNDNVMKLVHFKRIVDDIEGRKLLLVGGAVFAEALYPHIAFRPVIELEVLLRAVDVEGFAGYLGQHEFKPEPDTLGSGAVKVLSDGRTPVYLYADVLGAARRPQAAGIFERARPVKVYGPSVFRPDLEDALLLTCLEHARRGYDVPVLSFIDLRELLTGTKSRGGDYARALDLAALHQRAAEWGVERALYASVSITGRLFPEVLAAAEAARPTLRPATRKLLERLVVEPLAEVGSTRRVRGTDRLRRFLTGG